MTESNQQIDQQLYNSQLERIKGTGVTFMIDNFFGMQVYDEEDTGELYEVY